MACWEPCSDTLGGMLSASDSSYGRTSSGRRRPAKLALAVPVVAAVIGLAGCSSSSDAQPGASVTGAVVGPVTSEVPAATGTPQRVDAAAFQQALSAPGVKIVDVRTPAEFASGHIEGAVNIDVESPDFAAKVAQLDPAATYAVYCRSGNRSQTAVAIMSDAGIKNITELESGINGWIAAGYPTVQ